MWVTVDAPLGLPAVFVRDAACREALDAVRAMRAVDAKYPVRGVRVRVRVGLRERVRVS